MLYSTERLLDSPATSAGGLNALFLIAVGTMLLVFLMRAGFGYKRYKTSLFPHIYDNYLIDYFYKLNITQDASKSAKLTKEIGSHRLVFANLANKEGKLVCQTMTILHSKGVLVLGYLSTSGTISGKETGDWFVKRTEGGKTKNFRIENPVIYMKEYNTHLSQVLEGKTVQNAIAVKDDCDIKNIKVSYDVIHYSDVEALIKNADCGYGLNDAEIEEYFQKLGGKVK